MPLAKSLIEAAGNSTQPNYIEDVFSTYLYTGNGSTQTITNNIDLSTKGGMVWIKSRSAATNHQVFDTLRGATKELITNSNVAEATDTNTLTSFNSNGFSLDADATVNNNAATYVSWSFREQPKFFDVVTYTGDGSALKTITHNLGSTPGCMIIKSTSSASWSWVVYHQSLGVTQKLYLNTTGAAIAENGNFGGTAPTSTNFSVGYNATNESGGTYVAYLFAHDAGGFGLTGTDNVISCGSYSGNADSNGPVVTLGWEPQWVLIKRSAGTAADWCLFDTMRGIPTGGDDSLLEANTTAAEQNALANWLDVSATGFQIKTTAAEVNASSTYIYIAIRRGPMKVPTDGTKVFSPITGTYVDNTALTTGFPVDLMIASTRSGTTNKAVVDRLRGASSTSTAGGALLYTNLTNTETTAGGEAVAWNNTSIAVGTTFGSQSSVWWNFQRAPSFFDEVCYTGNSTAGRAITHNLGVAPELIIVKSRSAARAWRLWHSAFSTSYSMRLNNIAALDTATNILNSTSPTASVFTTSADPDINYNNYTYVAYLFASCPGVSKVGSYTGTGTTKQVDCGFSAGARFVLIKRTDSTGDWYVWDTTRGIVSGNDPYLLLNSTVAEVTTADYIDTYSAGFEISSTAPAAINASGGTFIFLAIA